MAEPAQFALDPHDAPPVILPGHTQDELDEIVRNRRSARRSWLTPLRPDILRCQRSNVPGVTIRCPRGVFGRIRASAASTARSGQVIIGFGFARRRIATSWRSVSISASFDAEDLARSASQDSTVTSSR